MSQQKARPSKKEFADLFNQITGQSTMTEEKLDQILKDAQKSYDAYGINGVFDYIRKLIQAPMSNEYLQTLIDQMKTHDGLEQLMKQTDLPIDVDKKKKIISIQPTKKTIKKGKKYF